MPRLKIISLTLHIVNAHQGQGEHLTRSCFAPHNTWRGESTAKWSSWMRVKERLEEDGMSGVGLLAFFLQMKRSISRLNNVHHIVKG